MSSLASHSPEPTAADLDDGRAFLLPGGAAGCLLLHGFTATPQEVSYLGRELHLRGYTVSGARLAGHGADVSEFARSTRRDWYASARDALLDLRARIPAVAVVGQSMGALLALQLAAERPDDVAAVALLAPAIRLNSRWLHWIRPLLPLIGGPNRHVAKKNSDIADATARRERRCYAQIPLSAFHELLQLQRDVRRLLSQVKQPVLIVHSRQDHTCSMASVEILKRLLPELPQVLIVEKSYHVLSVDRERDRVAATVAAFLRAAIPRP
ncbi:MAG: alpha/beta fold hydrolase [Deltaproteobacteria bacterium]|nr:alpha/beta fold hydrolase [Deltaproteobacteria bacterium]